jgi:hypothetical protein
LVGFELDRHGEVVAPPEQKRAGFQAGEVSVELVAVGETQQVGRGGGGFRGVERRQSRHQGGEDEAFHFS